MMADVLSHPAATLVQSSDEALIVVAEFPATTPDELFAYWTQPHLLQQWWPQQAETEPVLCGAYHLAWPAMNWHLRGNYTTFKPGQRLSFTWQWDHELTKAPMRWVDVLFRPGARGGTRLTIIHDPYAANESGEETRQGHLEGWQHFIGRLQQVQPAL